MKKLILSLTLVAFAFAVQAGDKECAGKDKAACSKTATSNKTACSADKTACTMNTGNSSCCQGTACKETRQTLMSPKGAEQAPKLIASR
jgi:hypothetical protein